MKPFTPAGRPRSAQRWLYALPLLTITLSVAEAAGPVDEETLALVRDSAGSLSRSQIAALVSADETLAATRDDDSRKLRGEILVRLAESGTTAAVEYVRGVFESEVDRRHDAAYAISRFCLEHRRVPADWRYLVRSLMVVEGEQAQSVVRALNGFRERATKPVWIRQVLLLALTFDEPGREEAMDLLAQWSGRESVPEAENSDDQLAAWQNWFRETYPDEPDPSWPGQPEGSPWSYQQLLAEFEAIGENQGPTEAGRAVFEKAACAKCHRAGRVGTQVGPELTRVAERLQRKQILQAILFPSLHLNEEYPSATVLLLDGRVLVGTVTSAGPDAVSVGGLDGKRTTVQKSEIDQVQPNRLSGMPSGLLNDLSLDEIRDLFKFLLNPPKAESS
ncbi:MAG: hypothetical protein DWQ29_16900 [Planctomycetota bacterium]|nr:MAG: hypothetical protein DWQ29_16900 [Planctomycetota bacterium]